MKFRYINNVVWIKFGFRTQEHYPYKTLFWSTILSTRHIIVLYDFTSLRKVS